MAAVGERRSRAVGKEITGHRNRNAWVADRKRGKLFLPFVFCFDTFIDPCVPIRNNFQILIENINCCNDACFAIKLELYQRVSLYTLFIANPALHSFMHTVFYIFLFFNDKFNAIILFHHLPPYGVTNLIFPSASAIQPIIQHTEPSPVRRFSADLDLSATQYIINPSGFPLFCISERYEQT